MCQDAFPVLYRVWWADVARRRPPNTARRYRYYVLRVWADVGRDPALLTRGQVKEYLGDLDRQHADVVQSALVDYYSFAVRQGRLASSPLEDVRRPVVPKRRLRRALSEDELIRTLIAAVYLGEGRQRWNGHQLAWAILAHYSIGARPGEFLALTVDDVNLNGSTSSVYLEGTKNAYSQRIMPLESLGVTAFGELIGNRLGRLLSIGRTQYWQKVKRAMVAAGLPEAKTRPYALRHSFATHLAEAGVHERLITELLGHVDGRHTHVYTVPSDPALRGAVAVLGARRPA